MNEEAFIHLQEQSELDGDSSFAAERRRVAILEVVDIEDSDDEYTNSKPIHYNPYRNVRFDSDESRDIVK